DQFAEMLAAGQVPEVDRSDGLAKVAREVCRGQRLAVGSKGETANAPLARAERAQAVPTFDVPDTDGAVPAPRNQRFAVPREEHRLDRLRVAHQTHGRGTGLAGLRHLPEAESRVASPRGERLAIGREGEAIDIAGVSAQAGPLLARRRIPEPHGAV